MPWSHTYICVSFQEPLIISASNDLDSSVMITSVKVLQNPNRRGATMRMNSEGVNFVSMLVNCTYVPIASYT